jgi:dTDP-4-dehydrorhamnose reductase
MPYKIFLTGCKGQLGSDLLQALSPDHNVKGVDIDDFDLRDQAKLSDSLTSFGPDIVIHPAAYTDVDGCESNVELAMESNATVTKNIALLCRDLGARLIFYSTDYLFDGNKGLPYVETDKPCPQTVYGQSKLAAEKYIAETLDNYCILRIAWLYGARGKNFPKTIIKAGLKQLDDKKNGLPVKPLMVVNDQIGNPTWTWEVVKQTGKAIEHDLKGIYHCTSEGEVSWFQLAKDIFEMLKLNPEIVPCRTDEFPRPAKRPPYSVLENRNLKKLGLNQMQNYKVMLFAFLIIHGGALLQKT